MAELSHVAALMRACGGDLESVFRSQADDWQRWARGQLRVFVEVFIGTGALALVVRNSKHTCSEGFDRGRNPYGQNWHLHKPRDQARFCWLIIEVMQPLGTHWGLPCTKWGQLGSRQPDEEA